MPRLPKGITLEQSEVSQTIEASDYLGDNADNDRVVQEFGQAIIDKILDRTAKGRDIFGAKLKGYDSDYVESEDFKEFGKKKGKVNMTLKGDMLDSLDFEQNGSRIKVAIGEGVETLKAYNHAVGDTLPQRAFFGVTSKELNEIAADFQPEQRAEPTTDDLLSLAAVRQTQQRTARDVFADMLQEFGIDFEG